MTLLKTLVVLAIFLLGFQIDLTGPIAQNDAVIGSIPYLTMATQGGSWNSVAYDFFNMGGIPIVPMMGNAPILQIGGHLGLSPIQILNMFTLAILFSIGYMFLNLREQIHKSLDIPLRTNFALDSTSLLLTFFSGLILYRLEHGHLNNLLGIFFFLFLVLQFLSGLNRSKNWRNILLGFFMCTNVFAYPCYQNLYYAVLVFIPIAVFFLVMKGKKDIDFKHLFLAMTPLVAAFVFDLDIFLTMFEYSRSADVLRGSKVSGGITFSYVTSTLSEIIALISSDRSVVLANRGDFFHHELHYPAGISLLVLPWTYFLQNKKLRLWLGLLTGLTCFWFLVSCDFLAIGQALEKFLPLYGAFRVPQRILIYPLLLFFGTMNLDSLSGLKSRALIFIGGLGAALGFLMPNSLDIWVLECFMLVAFFTGWTFQKRWAGYSSLKVLPLFLLVFIQIQAAKTIYRQASRGTDYREAMARLSHVVPKDRILAEPLSRAIVVGATTLMYPESYLGIPTVQGYWIPNRYFANFYQLRQAIDGIQLNVNWPIRSDGMFEDAIKYYNLNYLIDLLNHKGERLPSPFVGGFRLLNVVSDFPKDRNCGSGSDQIATGLALKVLKSDLLQFGSAVGADGFCVVLPITFSDLVRVYDGDTLERIDSFPVNDVNLGFRVKSANKTIVIDGQYLAPWWEIFLQVFGCLMVLVLVRSKDLKAH